MWTQRISSSAVCGYSSLSIMFLSNVSDISLLRFRLHPGAAESGEIEARAAVHDQLVVDQMVSRAGRHAVLGNGVAGRRPQQPLPRVHGPHHSGMVVCLAGRVNGLVAHGWLVLRTIYDSEGGHALSVNIWLTVAK